MGLVEIGMTGRKEETVTPELTVGGHVPGTPMMIMAMEVASGFAAPPHLAAGWVTVGNEVNIRHLAASPVGAKIVAAAKLIEVSGRSVLFAVEAHEGEKKIGAGRRRRVAVNLERFRERYAAL